MSVLALHRAGLVALVNAVPDVGLVHDHEPYARTEQAFRTLYAWVNGSGATQVRGWFLRRTATRERELGLGRTLNTHTWQLRGFLALDTDAGSERVFDELIESIRHAYRNDPTLGGAAALSPAEGAGMDVSDSKPVMFAGVLCHSALLTLTTHAYLDSGE